MSLKTFGQGRRRYVIAGLALGISSAMLIPSALADNHPPTRPAWTNTSDNPMPFFEYGGILTDPDELSWNPTDEFIFPSVFHAGAHFDDPLGEWYLYYSPHENPGGIGVLYSDSLEGPWTEYESNPVISNVWEPHYTVSHISTPEAVWREDRGEMFMYYHGENSTTRYATTTDGLNFEYGDRVLWNAMGGPDVIETSYTRVFPHPDEDSEYSWAAFYMGNERDNIRRIRLAESYEGIEWVVDPEYVVAPGPVEGQNVSSANLWEWEGQLYVIYHATAGKIFARTIDSTLREVGETPYVLREASGVGDDTGRNAAPDIVTDDTGTYLFFEAGHRLGAVISYAVLNPDAQHPTPYFPADPENPVFDFCAAPNSDEFDGAEIDDAIWTRTIRESADRNVIEDGQLVVPAYSGGVAAAPLLQQELPDGPWQITTKMENAVHESFQQGGLLLYAADGTYLKWVAGHSSTGTRADYVSVLNGGTPVNSFRQVPATTESTTYWFRLTSDGSHVTGAISLDGEVFSDFGHSVSLDTHQFTHVGPLGMRGGSSNEILNYFDWIRWSPSAVEYEACLDELYPPDVTAPVSSAAVSDDVPESGWFASPISVTLTAEDETGGSGIDAIRYTINGGAETVYSAPIVFDADGEYTLTHWAVDNAGNAEVPQVLTLSVDVTAPVSSADQAGDEEVLITLSSTDAASGVAVLEYSLDGESWLPYEAPFTVTRTDVAQNVLYRATDNAGNVEDVQTLVVAGLSDDGDDGSGGDDDGAGNGNGSGDNGTGNGDDDGLPTTGLNFGALALLAGLLGAAGVSTVMIRRRLS